MSSKAITLLLLSMLIAVASLIYWRPSIIEYEWLFGLVIWVLFVVFILSKWISKKQNIYVARKIIHILAGGLVAFASPYIFKSPAIPLIGGIGMLVLTLLPRLEGERMDWFQVEGNMGEIWFCFTWTIVMVGLWYIDLGAGVAAALFMSVGDGITGIVRNKVYKRWTKGLAGSIAMLLITLPIGWYYKGIPGIIGALVATLVEKWPKIDDNITVPLISAIVMVLIPGG